MSSTKKNDRSIPHAIDIRTSKHILSVILKILRVSHSRDHSSRKLHLGITYTPLIYSSFPSLHRIFLPHSFPSTVIPPSQQSFSIPIYKSLLRLRSVPLYAIQYSTRVIWIHTSPFLFPLLFLFLSATDSRHPFLAIPSRPSNWSHDQYGGIKQSRLFCLYYTTKRSSGFIVISAMFTNDTRGADKRNRHWRNRN